MVSKSYLTNFIAISDHFKKKEKSFSEFCFLTAVEKIKSSIFVFNKTKLPDPCPFIVQSLPRLVPESLGVKIDTWFSLLELLYESELLYGFFKVATWICRSSFVCICQVVRCISSVTQQTTSRSKREFHNIIKTSQRWSFCCLEQKRKP